MVIIHPQLRKKKKSYQKEIFTAKWKSIEREREKNEEVYNYLRGQLSRSNWREFLFSEDVNFDFVGFFLMK